VSRERSFAAGSGARHRLRCHNVLTWDQRVMTRDQRWLCRKPLIIRKSNVDDWQQCLRSSCVQTHRQDGLKQPKLSCCLSFFMSWSQKRDHIALRGLLELIAGKKTIVNLLKKQQFLSGWLPEGNGRFRMFEVNWNRQEKQFENRPVL